MRTANGEENRGRIEPLILPIRPLTKWYPFNDTKPATFPLVSGYYLATEDTGDGLPPVTIEAYWDSSRGWLDCDPQGDEAYELRFIVAWAPLPEPYNQEGE